MKHFPISTLAPRASVLTVALALGSALPGCARPSAPPTEVAASPAAPKIAPSSDFAVDPAVPGAAQARLVRVDTPYPGLSGLALAPDGVLWAVPERDRALLSVDPNTGKTGRPVPMEGVPEDTDTESLAWLGAGHLACGLEYPRAGGSPMVDGKTCDIMEFSVKDGKAQRAACLAFPYKAWDLTPERNHGIEGLCAAGDWLLGASETLIHRQGQRLAPLGLYRRSTATWTPHLLALSSTDAQNGKISALTCRPAPDGGLEVWAMERHFAVTHLLRFTVPPASTPDAAPLRPAAVRDLKPLVTGSPNVEGLALLPAGRLALINDSKYGHQRVDTVLLTLPLGAP